MTTSRVAFILTKFGGVLLSGFAVLTIPSVSAAGVLGQYVGEGVADETCHEQGADPSQDLVCENTGLWVVVNSSGSGSTPISPVFNQDTNTPGSSDCKIPNPNSLSGTGTPATGFHGEGTLDCLSFVLDVGPLTQAQTPAIVDFVNTCDGSHWTTSVDGQVSFGAVGGVPIPSEWGLLAVSGALVALGAVTLRRRPR